MEYRGKTTIYNENEDWNSKTKKRVGSRWRGLGFSLLLLLLLLLFWHTCANIDPMCMWVELILLIVSDDRVSSFSSIKFTHCFLSPFLLIEKQNTNYSTIISSIIWQIVSVRPSVQLVVVSLVRLCERVDCMFMFSSHVILLPLLLLPEPRSLIDWECESSGDVCSPLVWQARETKERLSSAV